MTKIRKPPAGAQPNQPHAAYKSTLERAPRQPAIALPQGATELSGPRFDRTLLYPHFRGGGRVMTDEIVTRIDFDGEAANQDDPVFALCGARASTLIARRDAAAGEAYTWNISMQGADETVFFEA